MNTLLSVFFAKIRQCHANFNKIQLDFMKIVTDSCSRLSFDFRISIDAKQTNFVLP